MVHKKEIGMHDALLNMLEDLEEEKKKSEESRKRFEKLYENAPFGIHLYEKKGKDLIFYSGNKNADKILGIKHSENEGLKIKKAFPKLEKQLPGEYMKTLKTGKTYYAGETKYESNKITGYFEVYAFRVSKNLLGVSFNDITQRKKYENQIEKEKERAKKYLDIAGTMIIALDKEGNITLLNKKGYEVLEAKEGSLIGKNWFKNFILKKQVDEVKSVFKKMISGKVDSVKEYENEVITKKENIKLIKFFNTLIKNKENKIVGLLISGEDITKSRAEHLKVKESEKKLKTFIENSPDAIYFNDGKGTFLDGNKAAEELTGFKKEELIGKNFIKLGLLKKREIPKAISLLAKNLEGKATKPTKSTLIKKNGEEIIVEISTYPIKENKKTIIMGIVRDVTEKAKETQKLVTEREKFKILFNNTNDAIYFHTLEDKGIRGRFIEVNDATIKMLGYSREEFLNMSPKEIDDPNMSKKLIKDIEKEFKKNKKATFKSTHITKKGKKIPVQISSKLFNYNGKTAILSIVRKLDEK